MVATWMEESDVVSVPEHWQGAAGEDLAAAVLTRLGAGQPLGDLGLGEVDGRVDLRGMRVPLLRRAERREVAGFFVEKVTGRVVLEGTRLAALDLSGAFLDGATMRDCVVEDCVFRGAHCRDLGIVRGQVRDCSFRDANLRESVLGAWTDGTGSEFRRVDFTRADLRESVRITAWLIDCDFSGARLDQVRFKCCGLIRCRFSGVLDETEFDGRVFADDVGVPNTAEDIDMSAAVLRLVSFRGFDLDAVKLPDEPSVRVIRNWTCVLDEALALVSGRSDETGRALRALIKNNQRGLAKSRYHPLGLFNRDDYVRLGGEELAVLAEAVFAQAEHVCQDPPTT
jgi:uncharacterized protein YjbI with pentapeptide repeats